MTLSLYTDNDDLVNTVVMRAGEEIDFEAAARECRPFLLQIAVGDTVPGYGKVTDIAQHGTAWVVQTEHSAIQ